MIQFVSLRESALESTEPDECNMYSTVLYKTFADLGAGYRDIPPNCLGILKLKPPKELLTLSAVRKLQVPKKGQSEDG